MSAYNEVNDLYYILIFLMYFFLGSVPSGIVWLHSQRTHAGWQIADSVINGHRAARHETAY